MNQELMNKMLPIPNMEMEEMKAIIGGSGSGGSGGVPPGSGGTITEQDLINELWDQLGFTQDKANEIINSLKSFASKTQKTLADIWEFANTDTEDPKTYQDVLIYTTKDK